MRSHREETKMVKQALADVAIRAKVFHGTGTAYTWLTVRVLNRPSVPHQDHGQQKYYSPACRACKEIRELEIRTLEVAQTVTGRAGDYDGRISIESQD